MLWSNPSAIALRTGMESAIPPSSIGTPSIFTIGAPNGRLEEARHICIIFSRLRYSSRYSAFPFRQFVVTSRQRVGDFT